MVIASGRVVRLIGVVLASVGLLAASTASVPGALPSAADTALVAVLAFHVRHEVALATMAEGRVGDGSDPAFAAVVGAMATQGGAVAARLDQQLRQWRISGAEATALRAAATDPATAAVGASVHLACSLQGPLTDLDQLRAAGPAQVTSVFSAAALTDALEGVQLARTAQPRLDDQTRSLAAAANEWHRLTIRRLGPYLLPTDQAFAETFTG